MSISNDFPVYNGITPSWSDVIIKATPLGGSLVDVKDIKSINTQTALEVGRQRGASGGRTMKRTTGSTSEEASITLYYPGFLQLLRALGPLAPSRDVQKAVSLVHFDIQMMFTPIGSNDIFDVRIRGCRYAGRTMNPQEGTDPVEVEVKLDVAEIVDVIDGVEYVLL
jgi:hypothetical protein